MNYVYGPEHQRVRQTLSLSGNGTSAYFAGSTWYLNGEDSLGLTYEREERNNGLTLQRHFLSAGGFVFAQITKERINQCVQMGQSIWISRVETLPMTLRHEFKCVLGLDPAMLCIQSCAWSFIFDCSTDGLCRALPIACTGE